VIKTIIVDDEVLARLGIQTFLADEENILVEGCFSSALEALEYLRQSGGTDIVISDIEMMGMNGLEFIETIKQEQLVIGTIIISSHSDFEYARQALKLEVDGYLLKQEINEEELVLEINKIYMQKRSFVSQSQDKLKEIQQFADKQEGEDCFYYVGVLKIRKEYDENGKNISGQMNENMLIGLLESILDNYENVHLFVPRQKEMFVIFKFSNELEQQTQKNIIDDCCYDLQQNVKLYINRTINIGLSGKFAEFGEVLMYYQNAQQAVALRFYNGDNQSLYFTSEKIKKQVPEYVFSTESFIEDANIEKFQEELSFFLEECQKNCVEVNSVQRLLIEKLNILLYKVINAYSLPETLLSKWNQKLEIFQVVLETEEERVLKIEITKIMKRFQEDLLEQLNAEEFRNVFHFIDRNLDKTISLSELSELSCMSRASFCKKFKKRTGMTLVQYVNQKKIDKVKGLLHNDGDTLGKIAEVTGFCSENYMVRVFKKVTGQTIKEYKRKKDDLN